MLNGYDARFFPITCLVIVSMTVTGVARGCSEGNYVSESGSCEPCPENHYSKLANADSCKACPEDKRASNDRTTCIWQNNCTAGYKYTPEGEKPCERCGPGTFSSTDKAVECTPCPGNEVALPGSSTCVKCKANHTPTSDKSTCHCAANFYAEGGTCVECGAEYESEEGATSVRDCRCKADLLVHQTSENNDFAMIEKQEAFHRKCKDRCKEVELNSVIRLECSFGYLGSAFRVYRCPNTPFRYYIMNYDGRSLLYNTLCNDTLNSLQFGLTSYLEDIFCGFDDLEPRAEMRKCSRRNFKAKYLYCRGVNNKVSTIQRETRCQSKNSCSNDEDHEEEFCTGTDEETNRIYGKFCAATNDTHFNKRGKFIIGDFVCDENNDCSPTDFSDEIGCTGGVYCDEKAATPRYYIKDVHVCDGHNNCNKENINGYINENDENPSNCPERSCVKKIPSTSNVDQNSEIIEHGELCNGITDCVNAIDEDIDLCEELKAVSRLDGVPCDNNTKWIKQKYLCRDVNHVRCDDGTDADTNPNIPCDTFQKCRDDDDTAQGDLLCNSTQACNTVYQFTSGYKACENCEKGQPMAVETCKNDKTGVVCMFNNAERFVDIDRICNGNNDCVDNKNGEYFISADEAGCKNGIFCAEGKGVIKLNRWKDMCSTRSTCKNQHDSIDFCKSKFLEELFIKKAKVSIKDASVEQLKKYLKWELLKEGNDVNENRLILNHKVFGCDSRIISDSVENVTGFIEDHCMKEEKFQCEKAFNTTFPLSKRVMQDWLCDGVRDCKNGEDEIGYDGKDASVRFCRNGKTCYNERTMKCDGLHDCGEGGDEVGCKKKGIRCRISADSHTDLIIEDEYVCDGYPDCPYSQVDEKICDAKNSKANKTKAEYVLVPLYSVIHRVNNEVHINQTKAKLYRNTTCRNLQGGEYLLNVCAPNGGYKDSCADHEKFYPKPKISFTCYNGTWYSDRAKNNSLDSECKTEEMFMPEAVDDVVSYITFSQLEKDGPFYDKSFYCQNSTNRRKCGIKLEKMCDFVNDCGDWSDEVSQHCANNFECWADGKIVSIIHIDKACNDITECINADDECWDACARDILKDPHKILGNVFLLVCVWIFGFVSLILNFYLIVTMSESAFKILGSMPYRFVYRILVTTISVGDIMVSIYLVVLACVDTFRQEQYCKVRDHWLTGGGCKMLGVISTTGNHISIFAMLTLSLFRLKSVVQYLWPRSITSVRAVRMSVVLVLLITVSALTIATVPLADSLKDFFVDRYYFPHRRSVFNDGRKESILDSYKKYWEGLMNGSIPSHHELLDGVYNRKLDGSSSWDDILAATELIFNRSEIMSDYRPFSFYSSHGVCLFNYLSEVESHSFSYVITVIALNLICFLLIIVSYIAIWKVGSQKSKSTERKLQKNLTIAVTLNIICRLPLFLICIAHSLTERSESDDANKFETGTYEYYRYMSVFIIPINSVINPFINSEVPILQILGIKKAPKPTEKTVASTAVSQFTRTRVQNSPYEGHVYSNIQIDESKETKT